MIKVLGTWLLVALALGAVGAACNSESGQTPLAPGVYAKTVSDLTERLRTKAGAASAQYTQSNSPDDNASALTRWGDAIDEFARSLDDSTPPPSWAQAHSVLLAAAQTLSVSNQQEVRAYQDGRPFDERAAAGVVSSLKQFVDACNDLQRDFTNAALNTDLGCETVLP